MPAKYIEIAVQGLNVNIQMGNCLGTVNQYLCTNCVGLLDDSGNRVDRSQCIGDVIYRDHFDPVVQQCVQCLCLGFVDRVDVDTVALGVSFVGESSCHLQALARSGSLNHVKTDAGHLPARSIR